ncbi:MAG TPA: hypothetical protein VF746_05960 [Longimicrobium sp.]|jgi:hypothetical protein
MRLPFSARILLGCCIFTVSAAAVARVQTTRMLVRVYDPRLAPPPLEPSAADSLLLQREVRPAAHRRWEGTLDDCGDDFEVMGAADGSFTRPGARQRVLLYRYCFVSHVIGGLGGIAVVEDGRVVAHFPFVTTATGIAAVPDLNGDGRSELLIGDGGYLMGESWSYASFAAVEPGGRGLRWLGAFDTGHDDCGMDRDRPRREGAVLLARPGARPAFFRQRLTAGCGDASRWVRRGWLEPAVPADEQLAATWPPGLR